MEAARTSETSVDNYFTRQYIPENKSELHTRRCENFKSHIVVSVFATGPKGCGFEPGQGDGFLRAIKILSTPSFRMGSKAGGPMS
jgi:hypothetical protein